MCRGYSGRDTRVSHMLGLNFYTKVSHERPPTLPWQPHLQVLSFAVIRGGGGGRDTKWPDVHQHFLLVTSVNRSRLSQHVMSGVYMKTHTHMHTHTGNGEGERADIKSSKKILHTQKKRGDFDLPSTAVKERLCLSEMCAEFCAAEYNLIVKAVSSPNSPRGCLDGPQGLLLTPTGTHHHHHHHHYTGSSFTRFEWVLNPHVEMSHRGLKHSDTSFFNYIHDHERLIAEWGSLVYSILSNIQLAHPKILLEVAVHPRGTWFLHPPTPPHPIYSSLTLSAAIYFVPPFPCCILVAFMTHPSPFPRSLYSRIISFCFSSHRKHLRHISDLALPAPAHS